MYQCLECGSTFLHTAKQERTDLSSEKMNMLKTYINVVLNGKSFDDDHFDMLITDMLAGVGKTERYVCPSCGKGNYQEVATTQYTDVIDVQGVPHAQVAQLISQGYVVHELYSKETIMKKYAPNETTENAERYLKIVEIMNRQNDEGTSYCVADVTYMSKQLADIMTVLTGGNCDCFKSKWDVDVISERTNDELIQKAKELKAYEGPSGDGLALYCAIKSILCERGILLD
jgi:transposase-like protein